MSDLAPTAPRWDSALLAKYDVAAPRYTSYPTALQFSENFGADDYRQLWRQQTPSIAPLSLYVHIPFCENICYYCACNKIVTRNKEESRKYLDYLQREIRLQRELVGAARAVTQLHWGGGTPTFLSAAEMTELMHALASHFKLLDAASREYSIEVDPRTVNGEALALLKGLGFNRLSFGIQDFDARVQKAINRQQSIAEVEILCAAARRHDFDSISFDLIYGLPYQSAGSLRRTLRQIVKLRPDRIALYNYAHLPRRFPSQRALSRLPLPTAAEKLAMLTTTIETLCAAGYLYIGMDHFVLPGDELARAQQQGHLQRNFQGYSTCLAPDLLSVGVSAISSTARGYAQNARNLQEYYAALDRGELPVARGLQLSGDDLIRRHVIMQIICNLTLDVRALEEKFDIVFNDYFSRELAQLQQLQNDALVFFDNGSLHVTEAGRLLLRNICMTFDRYLQHTAAARYSRSI